MSEPISDVFQTTKQVRRLLRASGLFASRRLGQNFLIDRNMMEYMVACAELTPTDLVLEVGAGTGGLTSYLLREAGFVISVEIDPRLADIARSVLGTPPHLCLLVGDALAGKHALSPQMLTAVTDAWKTGRFQRFKLVANLPYVVATPFVAELLRFEIHPERMCFTVQRELAERMLASPGTHDFGWLAVWVQSMAEGRVLKDIPPSCFYPRPKVSSSLVQLFPKTEYPAGERLRVFTELVRFLFQHRRKTLGHNLREFLRAWPGCPVSERELLKEAGLQEKVRAQDLPLEAFWTLTDVLISRTPA